MWFGIYTYIYICIYKQSGMYHSVLLPETNIKILIFELII